MLEGTLHTNSRVSFKNAVVAFYGYGTVNLYRSHVHMYMCILTPCSNTLLEGPNGLADKSSYSGSNSSAYSCELSTNLRMSFKNAVIAFYGHGVVHEFASLCNVSHFQNACLSMHVASLMPVEY